MTIRIPDVHRNGGHPAKGCYCLPCQAHRRRNTEAKQRSRSRSVIGVIGPGDTYDRGSVIGVIGQIEHQTYDRHSPPTPPVRETTTTMEVTRPSEPELSSSLARTRTRDGRRHRLPFEGTIAAGYPAPLTDQPEVQLTLGLGVPDAWEAIRDTGWYSDPDMQSTRDKRP